MNRQPTQSEVLEAFEYRDGVLYWKVRPSRGKFAGTIAGSLKQDGYVLIRLHGRSYRAHRLIYLMHHGFMPEVIDHVNGVKHDNRIENLRECTQAQNQWNRSVRANSKTGVKGVVWLPRKRRFRARIKANGVLVELGRFRTIEEASRAYQSAAAQLHGDFAVSSSQERETSMHNQLDIFDHDPALLAAKHREAAQFALTSGDQGYFTAQERYDHLNAEAERLERLAAMQVAA